MDKHSSNIRDYYILCRMFFANFEILEPFLLHHVTLLIKILFTKGNAVGVKSEMY